MPRHSLRGAWHWTRLATVLEVSRGVLIEVRRAFYLNARMYSTIIKMRIKCWLMSHSSGNSIVRVFFALWPTAGECSSLAAWQQPLRHLCGGRAMRGETLHNTLVFIGDVDQSRLEALRLAALEVSAESFELRFDEARYWGHNHIVYAAPGAAPRQLEQLVSALEQRLAVHRFKFEQREYKPHVTLLRNARWTDARLPGMHPVRWQTQDFALVQSIQKDELASYRVLVRFPLLPYSG
jgi:RNA 2',3'-cyclic 3'-phosphodiesterase